tara:strand:+ start:98 stop:355 length:258 start_codon:yes stop_codon:yes gene_type:complete
MTIVMKSIEMEKPAQTIRKAFLEKRLRLSDELGLSIYACHQWQRVPARHHYQVLKIAKKNNIRITPAELALTPKQIEELDLCAPL